MAEWEGQTLTNHQKTLENLFFMVMASIKKKVGLILRSYQNYGANGAPELLTIIECMIKGADHCHSRWEGAVA